MTESVQLVVAQGLTKKFGAFTAVEAFTACRGVRSMHAYGWPLLWRDWKAEYPEHDRKVNQSGVHRHPTQRHATHQCNRANARQPTPPTASNACSTTTTLG
jgi:hypothetical protein